MSNKEAVEIFAVIDRSGSMCRMVQEAIGGFNAFLQEQKSLPGDANITVVLFDNEYIVAQDRVPVAEAVELNTATYVPRGTTALNDAIGRSIAKLQSYMPDKAIILVITDGAENASLEFTNATVKQKVEEAQLLGWEVIFLAANIDAFAAGHEYGVLRGNTFAFAADAVGCSTAFATMSNTTTSYRTQ
jgi:uncharacterized protein with von Willebrand factor type A (vWA) domain